jgi:hypothetical protein
MNVSYRDLVPALCLSLAACQHQPPASPTVQPALTPASCPAPPEPAGDRWLARRESLCSLPMDAQRATLRGLGQSKAALSRTQRFEQLLLASCHPDMTPGLLREALVGTSALPDLADSERRLIEMIKDFDIGRRALEQKNEQLKSDLTKTIDGIRDIENETDNLPHDKEPR